MKARAEKAVEREGRQDELLGQFAGFACSACNRPLEIELVVSADVERKDGAATGYILFEHFCPCAEGTLHASRRLGSHQSFVRLFGTQPSLPYRASFSWQGEQEKSPEVARWAWELQQVADFDDFMLFLGAA